MAAGSVTSAVRAFEQAVLLQPASASFQHQLGISYQRAGRTVDAAVAFGKAIELAPEFFPAWNGLATVLTLLNDWESALTAAQRAVTLGPKEPSAYLGLARACQAKGESDRAQWAFNQALALHLNHAQALAKKRRFAAGWDHVRAALELAPKNSHAHFCAGVLCLGENKLEEAAQEFGRAIELRPNRPEFWTHLAQVNLRRGVWSAARECLRKALEHDPKFSDAHYLDGWLELTLGNLNGGWAKLEPRWILSGPRDSSRPNWEGEPLDGRTVLLYLNHGFGDTLHFVRYAPLVAACGGRVILECRPALKSLLESVADVKAVVANGEPLPPFDVQASLLSLPRILQTTLDRIPGDVPYLKPPVSARVVLPSVEPGFLKVGLAWSGSELLIFDQNRSMSLAQLSPLFSVPNVCFYSLQVGKASRQLRESAATGSVIDLGPQLSDFAATATAMAQMDLIITVDTSVAHLAGALGKPVWVMLLFFADWRWLLERADSPWYPTMRLFRQRQFNAGWGDVIARVREALTERAAELGTNKPASAN